MKHSTPDWFVIITVIGVFLFKVAGKAADELGLRFEIADNQSLKRLEHAQENV